ncbi:MAG: hypothetical protein LBU45_02285 [Azoarcus sp.]|nr:hypothetical protein [Azoarcus sp.]
MRLRHSPAFARWPESEAEITLEYSPETFSDRIIGFGQDERDYRAAHEMLAALAISRIALLINNPGKVRALREAGIDVVRRRALFGQLTDRNRRYLHTKARRHGHMLDELLAGVAQP